MCALLWQATTGAAAGPHGTRPRTSGDHVPPFPPDATYSQVPFLHFASTVLPRLPAHTYIHIHTVLVGAALHRCNVLYIITCRDLPIACRLNLMKPALNQYGPTKHRHNLSTQSIHGLSAHCSHNSSTQRWHNKPTNAGSKLVTASRAQIRRHAQCATVAHHLLPKTHASASQPAFPKISMVRRHWAKAPR